MDVRFFISEHPPAEWIALGAYLGFIAGVIAGALVRLRPKGD
jgi:hypothetical protein